MNKKIKELGLPPADAMAVAKGADYLQRLHDAQHKEAPRLKLEDITHLISLHMDWLRTQAKLNGVETIDELKDVSVAYQQTYIPLAEKLFSMQYDLD
tara:strand:+ start:91 stop:381 length:291 start_codon:yes stop_codon:yes gene_type:complete